MNASNGLPDTYLAEEAFNVYKLCTQSKAEYKETEWVPVAEVCIQMCDPPKDEKAEKNVSARDLARRCHAAYSKGDFDSLDLPDQLAWEAVGRHLGNGISLYDTKAIDLPAERKFWPPWIEKRIELVNS